MAMERCAELHERLRARESVVEICLTRANSHLTLRRRMALLSRMRACLLQLGNRPLGVPDEIRDRRIGPGAPRRARRRSECRDPITQMRSTLPSWDGLRQKVHGRWLPSSGKE
jgi:hypothetical protein